MKIQHNTNSHKDTFLQLLQTRFEQNMQRHKNIKWLDVQAKLENSVAKIKTLSEMEKTGGEPDVVDYDKKTGEYIFMDCSPETPKDRRNVCYDMVGQVAREKQGINPAGNAMDMAANIGIELLTVEQYKQLQELGEFDTKTSSWLKTPETIRKLGGAIFGDRRYNTVFIYHNSAPTFYKVRGFRGCVRV
jgi:hypothetical protein